MDGPGLRIGSRKAEASLIRMRHANGTRIRPDSSGRGATTET